MRTITFKPNESSGPVIILIGRRDTGKSYLIKDLLSFHSDIPAGIVISGTENSNSFFSSIVPKIFIHGEYKTVLIENVLRRQREVMKEMKKEAAHGIRSTIDPRTFVILDDCLYDSSWTREKLMRLLFMNGRHWHTCLIISMQYALGIPPVLRTNIDYVFILREPNFNNRKKLWEHYASVFPSFEAFNQIMNQTTENYECLVINMNVKSNKLEDQVFWYKAQERPPFRLGSQKFWDMSAAMDSDDDDDKYDPSRAVKKNVQQIIVKKTNR